MNSKTCQYTASMSNIYHCGPLLALYTKLQTILKKKKDNITVAQNKIYLYKTQPC